MKSSNNRLDAWKELHKLYLDDAKERIGRARTTLLLMLSALVTMWLSGIEPKVVLLNELFNISQSKAAIVGQLEKLEERRIKSNQPRVSTKSADTSSDEDEHEQPIMTDQGSEWAKEKKMLENKKETAADKLKEKLRDGVGFRLLGFEFPVPPVLAPSIWMAMLLLMLVYMSVVRGEVFRALRIASCIEKDHLRVDPRERLLNVPWWLSPMPPEFLAENNPRVDVMMGWRSNPPRFTGFALGAAVGMFVSAGFVLSANRDLVSICADETFKRMINELRIEEWHLGAARSVPWIAVGIGTLLISSWWMQMRFLQGIQIPDVSSTCSNLGRRRFLQGLFPVGLSLIACGIAPTLSWRSKGSRRDRTNLADKLLRIRSRRSTPIPGLKALIGYKGPRSAAIHMTTAIGSFRFPKLPRTEGDSPDISEVTNLALSGFEPQPGKIGSRLVLAEASWALEQVALNALNEKTDSFRISKSCDVLLCLVKHDIILVGRSGKNPNYRACDLLAGLSVRAKTDHLKQLIAIINSSQMREAFINRIRKWEETDTTKSRWLRRWQGSEKSKRKVWATSVADGVGVVAQKKVLRSEMT